MAFPGRGLGRSSLLEKMKKQAEEEELRSRQQEELRLRQQEELRLRQQEELRLKEEQIRDAQESKIGSSTSISSGKGRGNLLEMLKKSAVDSSSPIASTTGSVTSTQTTSTSSGKGRGQALSAFMKKPTLDSSRDYSSGDATGVLGKLSSLSLEDTRSSVTSEQEVVSRQGVSGKKISVTANYVLMKVDKDKGMYQYEVKYTPDIDSRNFRFILLNQHLNDLGNVKTFDGTILYLPIKLQNEKTIFTSVHPQDNSTVTLTIIFKKKQAMKDNITFFNVLFNRILKALTLVRIGRHDYNPTGAHKIPQHRLEVWPGYVHSVHELEGGVLLNLDASHRVMRLDTVRDLMSDMINKSPSHFKKLVINEVVGTSVLTRYNNRTYRVDDIDWDKTPAFKFQKDDEEISLFEYYQKHYNLTIKDMKQPLLVHRSKHKKTTGETFERITLLIPELCFLAGITDSIRSDFRITKDLATVTKISPEQRKQVISNFIQQVNGNETTRKILSDWGLQLLNDTVDLTARVLDPEKIIFGQNQFARSNNAEWARDAVSKKVFRTPNMMNWAVVCTNHNKKNCKDFLETLKGVCNRVAMEIQNPQIVFLSDDNTDTYVNEIRKLIKKNIEMIVIIFPSLRQDKYSAVKKVCCVEYAIPSQVIIAKTISRPDKIKSVTEKIALQINCKLGGALWALQNPYKNAMVCGIDVYHAGSGSSGKASVAAFVASLDQMLTMWHSRVCLQQPHQELIDLLKQCLLSAMNTYRARNECYPDNIFIYRDGVGDGQLETVKNYEIKQFIQTCESIDPTYKPKISVIIVQKRVNTRIFEKREQLSNPPPGTIVDSCITRRYLYDFYLVPQLVRQGTVTPTHYIILHDGANIKTDHMQRFTYKLCHLYYNWPGTIRVPAPCQYAHKLAYLVGQSIKTEPKVELNNFLYYL